MPRLVEEIAYEQWHRLLFARFLAENDLLMHPAGVAVTLEECAELAPEEGAEDRWELAARYAVAMLPGIFLLDDPAMQVRFAPEGRQRLEAIVTGLPSAVFTSDDGLGWAYQFWQSKRKDEVNRSERKIGGADIAPVTQLFTESYMVEFLLHNSLGAWWAARHPDSPLVDTFDYLRFREDGTPAAGTFEGWPKTAAEVTMMDPAAGSGHFIIEAFRMLYRMRMEEEGLTAAEAGDAVIRDNVFGLEIDPRCTQIAAFNLALTAWKAGGYRELPLPNIACSGIPVQGQLEDWVSLAGQDATLQRAMERLYRFFRNAPDLGSLINPAHIPVEERMFVGDYELVESLMERALKREEEEDPTAALFGEAIKGVTRAAKLLSDKYTLVATNVPYLSRAKQTPFLQEFCDHNYPDSKRDLATSFVDRCRKFTRIDGSYAIVTPQTWLYLNAYEELRVKMLKQQSWKLLNRLGTNAFRTISGEIVNVALYVITNSEPESGEAIVGFDLMKRRSVSEKKKMSKTTPLQSVDQASQLYNPDARVAFVEFEESRLLGDYAESLHGQGSFDNPCYVFHFWEMDELLPGWILQQTTGSTHGFFSGCTNIFRWEDGEGMLFRYMQEKAKRGYTSGKWKAGTQAWGKKGVAISGMSSNLYVNLYTGESFDTNVAVVVPFDEEDLAAVWHYCVSQEFADSVRRIDKNLKISCNTYLKVPFDLEYWREIAESSPPLPEPHSNDPTQWLFEGDPTESTAPLQVAVARLAGYHWPQQTNDSLTPMADEDGILCLPSVAGEAPAADRLRALLAAAYGDKWNLERQQALLAGVEFEGKTLHEWLRDGFFIQHCRLFGNRPFIWHIWDGQRDGFNVLVNYHMLDTARLERLIYTYLGDWIRTQRAEAKQGVSGAEGLLVAALELKEKLEAILEGEPPYDIYVRWKELHEQPIGWDPDLNDGVRLNIRPFVKAGVLRRKFSVHWRKDRGKNPDGSLRHNDLHYTRAEKFAARREAAQRSAPDSDTPKTEE